MSSHLPFCSKIRDFLYRVEFMTLFHPKVVHQEQAHHLALLRASKYNACRPCIASMIICGLTDGELNNFRFKIHLSFEIPRMAKLSKYFIELFLLGFSEASTQYETVSCINDQNSVSYQK